ncbi:hypothetical protein E3W66_09410 [Gammaproteobacteria bacterium LSUCC0057]|uniref:Type II secretion system protein GspC N-terminal domain-containing protein n=1 Tax=Gammaproteobacteria bacterium LSUCC0057 TaxID=2559237 RepID=A0A4Y8UHF8_9GAMM|nr:hypothetical protein E3W66_09410 [Gammaproteobacteria bacterium LSUCC0057]
MTNRFGVVLRLFGRGWVQRASLLAMVVALLSGVAVLLLLTRPPVELRLASPVPPAFEAPNWFAAVEPAAPSQPRLATANLRGELLGVLVAGARSTATVKLQGKPEQVFRLGEELEPGVVLVAVEAERVILRQRGQQRELVLASDSLAASEWAPTVSADESSQADSEVGVALALSGLFRAQPTQYNGSSALLLSDIGAEMAVLTDLQTGDLVVAVEYQGEQLTIDQLSANPALWSALALNSELPVTVVRNDNEITLQINAASLAARVMPNLNTQ